MRTSNRRKIQETKKRFPFTLLLSGIGLILIGFLMWLSLDNSNKQAVNSTPDLGIPFPNIQRVSLDEAKRAFDSQSAIFVDVRDSNSYAQQHIKGAINIPLGVFESHLDELPKDRWIILYCT